MRLGFRPSSGARPCYSELSSRGCGEREHLLTVAGEMLRRCPSKLSDMLEYADSTFQQFAAVAISRVFAYARVSTVEQITENQREQIAQAGYAIDGRRLVEEKVSGSVPASQRPGLEKLLERMEPGDTLVVTKQGCIGRDSIDVQQTVQRFERRGDAPHRPTAWQPRSDVV